MRAAAWTAGAARRAAVVLVAFVLAAPLGARVDAGEPPARKLPFADELPPPPPLPEPLDRRFRAKLVSFDGDRVGYRWGWESDAELDDFEPFVPVRASVRGGFTRKDGAVEGEGTAGLRLRLTMLADLRVGVDAVLADPHDLGVVLSAPGTSDESILCLVQDRFFTRFDRAAGNTNMINKMGGIPATAPGVVEFRYVDRKPQPKLAKGHHVRFDVVRKGPETTFTIAPKGEAPTVLRGKDPDTPMTRFQPGIYVSGSGASFGPLEIEGRIDAQWCQENGVLPHVAADLLHPGNRFKGPERKAAETVETYAKVAAGRAEPDPKHPVTPETIAALVGDAKLPLVVRIRAAEALADSGEAEGGVGANVARLLDAADLETRVLAWRVLRPRLPWHFRYEPDGDPAVRREAALLVANYLREEHDAVAQGKVFVEGYWYTPSRADQIRADWSKAWDLRGPHVRLKTNLTKEWADWTLAALELGYREMVRLTGREPPRDRLPLSVLVFAKPDEYREFCSANGYDDKLGWKRFADLDRGVGLDTFDRGTMPAWPLHLLAKLVTRASTGMTWPTWFEEGRASWFASGDLKNASFDGTTLLVGQPARGMPASDISAAASQQKLWSTADFLAKDPRTLVGEERRLWYAHAWALHSFLMDAAPEDDRRRFAEWQSTLEQLRPNPLESDAMGRRVFLAFFARDLDAFEGRFREWAKKL
jgi:hypothetical protein